MLIGVISDTHGYLDPRALPALQGVAHILHAGDIGSTAIIEQLEQIAPVTAVYGNTDAGTTFARQLPASRWLEWEGVRIYMTHIGGQPADLAVRLPATPSERPHVYIFGHTHVALLEKIDQVLFLNPGAAGRPRFGGGLSVARLMLNAGQATAEIVPFE
jgi:putative phosphoesterase